MPELNLGRIKGADGAPGKDGKSAYQYAVDGGYKGTEDDFKRSMAEAPWLSLSGGKMEGPILPPEDHIFAKSKNGNAVISIGDESVGIGYSGTGSDDFCGMSSLSGSVKMVANNGGVESGRVEVSASNGVSIRGLTDPVSDTDAVNKKYGDLTYAHSKEKGNPNGLATLGEDGKIPDSQIKEHFPVGGIILWSGAADAVPAGWTLCNGQNGAPDLRDRFVIGAGNAYAVGDTGGEATHKLTVEEMPQHNHGSGTLNTDSGGNHTHSYSTFTTTTSSAWDDRDVASASTSSATTGFSGSHSHSISGSTSSAGSGQAHNNLPPYYALCYIMKI